MALAPNPKNRKTALMAIWKPVYRVEMRPVGYDEVVTTDVQSLKAAY